MNFNFFFQILKKKGKTSNAGKQRLKASKQNSRPLVSLQYPPTLTIANFSSFLAFPETYSRR